MRPISILAESNSDLSPEWQKKLGVDFLYAHISVPGRGELPALTDWSLLDHEEFFSDLKRRPEAYTTSPPNVEEYAEKMRENCSAGKDTIAITLSNTLSGSFSFLSKAAQIVRAEFPEAQIACIDSRRFGPAIGLMAKFMCELRDRGCDFDTIVNTVEEKKNCFRQAGWLDDLTFVARKGRVSHAKAFFGTLAGVKPIGEFDSNGMTTVLGKAPGAKAALELMVSYLEETIVDAANQDIFIAQSCRAPQAEAYKKLIEERIKPRSVTINELYCSAAVNVGPGLMAAYYLGKPISPDLSAEKALFERLSKR